MEKAREFPKKKQKQNKTKQNKNKNKKNNKKKTSISALLTMSKPLTM